MAIPGVRYLPPSGGTDAGVGNGGGSATEERTRQRAAVCHRLREVTVVKQPTCTFRLRQFDKGH